MNPNKITETAFKAAYESMVGVCECGHFADQHNDEQPHECLELTLKGRARCSCSKYKHSHNL